MMYHRGHRIQAGQGLGSIFRSVMRGLIPVAKATAQTVGRVAKSRTGKAVGRALKEAALNTTLDVIEGEKVGASAQQRLKKATKDLVQHAVKVNERKRKRTRPAPPVQTPKRRRRPPPKRSKSPLF